MAKRSLPIWQRMVVGAGARGGGGKGSTFFSLFFISFLCADGVPGWRSDTTIPPVGSRQIGRAFCPASAGGLDGAGAKSVPVEWSNPICRTTRSEEHTSELQSQTNLV